MIAKARQEAEKLEPESDEPAVLYHVWFDAESECELLHADTTRFLSTQLLRNKSLTSNFIE
jgi:hypothetical protein